MKKIVICGSIGVGKTSTVEGLVGSILNSEAVYEKFEENDHLPNFYKTLEEKGFGHYNKYCFPTQMTFLHSRAKRELNCLNQDKVYILDRGLMEDKYIFGQNQIDQGFMSEMEIQNYTQKFDSYMSQVALPDLVIYLTADIDVLKDRIKKRGRDMEASIKSDYLFSLQKLYDGNLIPELEKNYSQIKIMKYNTNDISKEEVLKRVGHDILSIDKSLKEQKQTKRYI